VDFINGLVGVVGEKLAEWFQQAGFAKIRGHSRSFALKKEGTQMITDEFGWHR